ncbi:glycosyltransferase family 87 protein [Pandoraea bronchicola]|uniref:DUF2029 domain-containing protein n=1 Tax=Pandoraea bronchicola TaxID=2508287 RepID=A0A5E5BMW1_9BURK|nr:glycosyltransferase family 87 protein [Pandoraea bronchicola]VVE87199.1 hypothetical protein PBR20603_01126 [Pandoraea bronchicola]
MQIADSEIAKGIAQHKPSWLTRERVVVYSAAVLLCQWLALGIWAVRWMLHEPGVPPMGVDFRVFWSASYLSLHDSPQAAFDLLKIADVEDSMFPGRYAPWVYPPTFQLLVYPLALLPYALSYVSFCAAGIACVLWAFRPTSRRGSLPWITVVAFPGIWIATAHGQNSLLTAALAAGALGLLERRPWLAGVCAGMLLFKPQFAVLFPLLFLCGRYFRALAAMTMTATLFVAISGWVFGIPLWIKFFEAALWFNSTVTDNVSGGVMRAMPSVFATVRRLGGSVPVAYAVHAAVAIPVVLATLWLWTRTARFEIKAAAAVIATLIIQPYILHYDLAWLLLPIVCLCHDRATRRAWTNLDRFIVCLAWCLPLLSLLPSYFPAVLQPGVLVLPAMFIVTIATNCRKASHPSGIFLA